MKRICLYCGSRMGARAAYVDAAERLGRAVAEAGLGLVYGGGDVGLMGIAAQAAMSAGGHVTGFMPQHIVDLEIAKGDVSNLVITETMHERKKLMLYNADAVVALPGGAGTLDELVEVLTWRQLGLHEKRSVLVNTDGYWEPFLALLRHCETEGFAGTNVRGFLEVVETPEEAVALLRE